MKSIFLNKLYTETTVSQLHWSKIRVLGVWHRKLLEVYIFEHVSVFYNAEQAQFPP